MRRRLQHLALCCDLPEDTLAGGARATMFGRTRVLVEGQRGVVELAQDRIRLRTGEGVISILGSALILRELSSDAAMIEGENIVSVTYGA